MKGRISDTFNLLRNMGWRYCMFRIKYEFLRRLGLLQRKFPVNPPFKRYILLEDWKRGRGNFFFKSRESLTFAKAPSNDLETRFNGIRDGKFVFFNSLQFDLGNNYDWLTNPETGYRYDVGKHWTLIEDYSEEAGDIKYVWEKSRFSFLYDIIRYDYHFDTDCAAFVFSEIEDWIRSNPINRGPNYRCSQETSLRVLNWTFALYYYRDSAFLTDDIFEKIQFAIYWQMDHVYKNINFSRIAVRNNHAITETMALYLVGLLYPQFPGALKWKEKGKKWFEEEIRYQVYDDGTFLQFSMNYHRVVVQLLTWAIVLAEKNRESLAEPVYDRARKSVKFLRTCMVDQNGQLPNYGANDGALFFKLNDSEYSDFRQSIDALACSLDIDLVFEKRAEDCKWYGLENTSLTKWQPSEGIHSFNEGGYYILRELDTLTFIRCGNHHDRPSQADNLHVDVWYKGQNILMDAGSYKYNTDKETLRYFMGTASHNTVMLGENDQMRKGGRFIWYYWTQRKGVAFEEENGVYNFWGSVIAFEYLSKNIIHQREIQKVKGKPKWIIKDTIRNKPDGISMKQLWHLPLRHFPVKWESSNENQVLMARQSGIGFVSGLYGQKDPNEVVDFKSEGNIIETIFEITV